MRVRAMPVIDQLDRGDERLVLLEERAIRLVGLAPALLDLSREWCSLADLADQLQERFGPPDGVDAAELVRHAAEDLAAEGLVELDEEMIDP